jgi:hypothetical protein
MKILEKIVNVKGNVIADPEIVFQCVFMIIIIILTSS